MTKNEDAAFLENEGGKDRKEKKDQP